MKFELLEEKVGQAMGVWSFDPRYIMDILLLLLSHFCHSRLLLLVAEQLHLCRPPYLPPRLITFPTFSASKQLPDQLQQAALHPLSR